MKCFLCENEDWHGLPDANPDRLLLVCKTKDCGNVQFKLDDDHDVKMKDYYRTRYREAPTSSNVLSTSAKLEYIRRFLDETIRDKKGLVCGDIGAATGYALRWLKSLGHKVTGSEWGINFRRFSEHFYKIPLTEELDTKHKYDVLILYHVLEHLAEPDKKLKGYADILKDDGRILIALPEWFCNIEEASGYPLFDSEKPRNAVAKFRHWFHKDHVNPFSEKKVKALFRKCGLAVVNEDHAIYGQTYLVRKLTQEEKDAPVNPKHYGMAEDTKEPIFAEQWEEKTAWIQMAAKAIALLNEEKFQEAIDLYPRFPEAWIQMLFNTYNKIPQKQEEVFKKAFEVLPDNIRLKLAYAIWLYQRERYKEALEGFDWILNVKPTDDVMIYRGYCLYHLGQYQAAISAFMRAADMNPNKWQSLMDWACKAACAEPAWDERAMEALMKQAMDNPATKPQLPVEAVTGGEK